MPYLVRPVEGEIPSDADSLGYDQTSEVGYAAAARMLDAFPGVIGARRKDSASSSATWGYSGELALWSQ